MRTLTRYVVPIFDAGRTRKGRPHHGWRAALSGRYERYAPRARGQEALTAVPASALTGSEPDSAPDDEPDDEPDDGCGTTAT